MKAEAIVQRGDYLRWLYRAGRPNAFARWQNGLSVRLNRRGLGPKRLVTLQVPGRHTGQIVSCPVVIADVGGERHLVAMLGQRTNWVANVGAADGHATLARRTSQRVRLDIVPVDERAPIMKRFLAVAPGARPHIPIDRHAALAQFSPSQP